MRCIYNRRAHFLPREAIMDGSVASKDRGKHLLVWIVGGFLATLLVSLTAQPVAHFLGFPEFDFAKGLVRGLTSRDVPAYSSAWWMGMATHFFIGAIVF